MPWAVAGADTSFGARMALMRDGRHCCSPPWWRGLLPPSTPPIISIGSRHAGEPAGVGTGGLGLGDADGPAGAARGPVSRLLPHLFGG